MTFKKLKDLIKKYDLSNDVELLSDSGWECNAAEMNGIYYNEKENHIIFTQESSSFNKYHNDKDYKELK